MLIETYRGELRFALAIAMAVTMCSVPAPIHETFEPVRTRGWRNVSAYEALGMYSLSIGVVAFACATLFIVSDFYTPRDADIERFQIFTLFVVAVDAAVATTCLLFILAYRFVYGPPDPNAPKADDGFIEEYVYPVIHTLWIILHAKVLGDFGVIFTLIYAIEVKKMETRVTQWIHNRDPMRVINLPVPHAFGLMLAFAAATAFFPRPSAYTALRTFGWRNLLVGEAFEIFKDVYLRFASAVCAFFLAYDLSGAPLGYPVETVFLLVVVTVTSVTCAAFTGFLAHRAVYGLPDPKAKTQ